MESSYRLQQLTVDGAAAEAAYNDISQVEFEEALHSHELRSYEEATGARDRKEPKFHRVIYRGDLEDWMRDR